MKVGSAMIEGMEQLVVVSDDGIRVVTDLASRYEGPTSGRWTMERLMQEGEEMWEKIARWEARAQHEGFGISAATLTWLAPVPRPGKILCVGLNYRPHAVEAQLPIPDYPVLFNKFGSSVVGNDAFVSIPDGVEELDYEAELVLVIGKKCRNVTEENALRFVAGYCNGNDVSARDLQRRTSQWLLGKVLDGFAPMGPYLVTSNEVADPDALEIIGLRNGEAVQHSNTRHMIFSCRTLVSYISRYMTLYPGDIIFTGTPEGVILGKPEAERQWLSSGEEFTVAIEGLGQLKTTIAE